MRKVPCVVMAGGKGSRFGGPHKIFANVCGEPVIIRLLKQLREVCNHITVALSRNTMIFAKSICVDDVDCVETSGRDFVEDLTLLLASHKKPVLIVAGDTVAKSYKVFEEFVEKSMGVEADITNIVVGNGRSKKLVGVSMFKKESGLWIDIEFDANLITDIDTCADVVKAENVCVGDV